MTIYATAARATGFALMATILASPALAKPARCFTTDDGYFPCDFRSIDKAGSFEISGEGVPGYSLLIDRPGFAFGFVKIDGRTVPLPGEYVRSRDDGACWANPETDTKICAW